MKLCIWFFFNFNFTHMHTQLTFMTHPCHTHQGLCIELKTLASFIFWCYYQIFKNLKLGHIIQNCVPVINFENLVTLTMSPGATSLHNPLQLHEPPPEGQQLEMSVSLNGPQTLAEASLNSVCNSDSEAQLPRLLGQSVPLGEGGGRNLWHACYKTVSQCV